MADILLFGATGFTGRLTASALQEAGASFVLAGRDRQKLETLAAEVDARDIRIADVTERGSVRRALQGCAVIISTVGPFVRLGDAALDAALATGAHYVDSTGEGAFIDRILERRADIERAGIAVAPALGFDEVPGDLAVALAAEDLERPEIAVTYALPRNASRGTLKSMLGIIGAPGPFIENGRPASVRAGDSSRWSPMPPPLGPKRAVALPLALTRLAPLHVDAESFGTFVVMGETERIALRWSRGVTKLAGGALRGSFERAIARLPEGPEGDAREARWTILAEAIGHGGIRRNVSVQGKDAYGLTAHTLTAAAMSFVDGEGVQTGVLSPVQALGVERAREVLERLGTRIEIYG